MKLARIPGSEPTVKFSFNLKQSTSTLLHEYQKLYNEEHQVDVALKDIVEQMLLHFMGEDKDFQRNIKKSPPQKNNKTSVSETSGTADSGQEDPI